MIKTMLLTFLLCPIFVCAQQKNVTIRIEQEGVSYPASGQEINLRKQPFKISVTLHQVHGIYLFAGFTDSIYKLSDDQKIPDFEDIPAMTMAEVAFNADQELIISNDGWAYWFYDKKIDWHRFDKDIRIEKDSVIGTKSVKQFYFPPTEKTMQVSDVTEPLYLFFVAVDEEDKKNNTQRELLRLKVKINWE